jgi:predicted DNA-binding transcriptional regulator YafY
MSANLELRQVLNLLPRLAKLDGRPVEEACAALELTRPQLFQLVQSASALAWGDHDEGELIDIWEENGRLCVHTGGLFEQAVRLLPPELLALRLGAAQLTAAGLGGELQVEVLLSRIEESLAGGEPGVAERLRQQVGAQPDPALRPDLLEAVLAAHRERRVLRIWYYSRHSDRLRPRDVEAWRPFQSGGVWYLQALDRDLGEERMFRLDRVAEWQLLDEGFPEPPAQRLEKICFGPECGPRQGRARIRGSLARMAREQQWPDVRELANGDVEMDLAYDDPDPLLRYLLTWVPDVAVVDPDLRPAWLALLDEMRQRHGGPAGNP